MEFDKIVLPFKEYKILCQSQKQDIPKDKCERLLRLHLVFEIKKQLIPGGMLVGTGLCRISNTGIDYILYRKDLWRARFTVPIVVSVLTTLLLNGAIWLLPRLLRMIQMLI